MKKLLLLLLLPLLIVACQQDSVSKNKKDQGGSLLITSFLGQEQIASREFSCQKKCQVALGRVQIEPVPAEAVCTMIYGGPEEISLRGRVNGERIDADFNRSGGCEIERFQSLKPLLLAADISSQELFPRPGFSSAKKSYP